MNRLNALFDCIPCPILVLFGAVAAVAAVGALVFWHCAVKREIAYLERIQGDEHGHF
ncbi:hypothetical protein [Methylovulum psychrotolerans]|uniref:Uncharacterized protein n=1 Tax=Methylovulum psychrotolerans TaxID=1704499 RepID=A0A2S5CGD8_9GAMM|nr:hypothetical protein [Methylovulum psychrotolerans]POZ49871.1 hypothetical protein AADEFJLK_04317 [Methylovulum psychrotolerans]